MAEAIFQLRNSKPFRPSMDSQASKLPKGMTLNQKDQGRFLDFTELLFPSWCCALVKNNFIATTNALERYISVYNDFII